jgi:hypothetical protein
MESLGAKERAIIPAEVGAEIAGPATPFGTASAIYAVEIIVITGLKTVVVTTWETGCACSRRWPGLKGEQKEQHRQQHKKP